MFGNHPLPNIAPSLLLFLPPPPPNMFPPPPPLFPSRPPAWAKRGRAHCQCQRPPTTPHHHCSTAPASATAQLLPVPSSRDVGDCHLPCHHLQKTLMPRHPHRQQPLQAISPPMTPATSPQQTAVERHVTRTEASGRIGGSEEEGKREWEAPGERR